MESQQELFMNLDADKMLLNSCYDARRAIADTHFSNKNLNHHHKMFLNSSKWGSRVYLLNETDNLLET